MRPDGAPRRVSVLRPELRGRRAVLRPREDPRSVRDPGDEGGEPAAAGVGAVPWRGLRRHVHAQPGAVRAELGGRRRR